ncbi:hypothetical protein COCC4DRAFT_127104, partial [Bipolaris maydis ATCC 48331]
YCAKRSCAYIFAISSHLINGTNPSELDLDSRQHNVDLPLAAPVIFDPFGANQVLHVYQTQRTTVAVR